MNSWRDVSAVIFKNVIKKFVELNLLYSGSCDFHFPPLSGFPLVSKNSFCKWFLKIAFTYSGLLIAKFQYNVKNSVSSGLQNICFPSSVVFPLVSSGIKTNFRFPQCCIISDDSLCFHSYLWWLLSDDEWMNENLFKPFAPLTNAL